MNVTIDQHMLEGVVIGLSEMITEEGGGAAEMYVGKLSNGHFVKIVVLDADAAKEDGNEDEEHQRIVTDAT